MAWALVALLAFACAAFIWLIRDAAPATRVLGSVLAVYFVLGFVLRPVVLLIVNPSPRFADALADGRLIQPDYSTGLVPVLTVALLGSCAFMFGTVLADRGRTDREAAGRDIPAPPTSALLALYALGWLGRSGVLAAGASGVTLTAAALAPIALCFGALRGRWLIVHRNLLLAIVAGEFVWSVLYRSKTPIFAAVLVIAIAWLQRPRQARAATGKLVRRLVIAAVGIPFFALAFLGLQSIKVNERASQDLSTADAYYPPVLRPALPVARRFDLLVAVTDAVGAGPYSYLSPAGFSSRLVVSLVPSQLVSGKRSSGEDWNLLVRAQTLRVRPGVSLADGPAAEGYAVFGSFGVIFEGVVMGLALSVVAQVVTKGNNVLFGVAAYLISTGVLFERGLLGLAEGCGKGLQVALLSAVVIAAFSSLRSAAQNEVVA